MGSHEVGQCLSSEAQLNSHFYGDQIWFSRMWNARPNHHRSYTHAVSFTDTGLSVSFSCSPIHFAWWITLKAESGFICKPYPIPLTVPILPLPSPGRSRGSLLRLWCALSTGRIHSLRGFKPCSFSLFLTVLPDILLNSGIFFAVDSADKNDFANIV